MFSGGSPYFRKFIAEMSIEEVHELAASICYLHRTYTATRTGICRLPNVRPTGGSTPLIPYRQGRTHAVRRVG